MTDRRGRRARHKRAKRRGFNRAVALRAANLLKADHGDLWFEYVDRLPLPWSFRHAVLDAPGPRLSPLDAYDLQRLHAYYSGLRRAGLPAGPAAE